ncbi:MAG: ketosteroid isomerase-related protein [Lysobacterales bacterium]
MSSATAGRELIHRYYLAFNRADWAGMLDMLAEDVIHDLNQGAREIGRARFESFLQRMRRCYLEVLSDIEIMVSANGQRAAAEYVVSGQYLSTDEGLPAASGQRYRLAGGAFFEIRDGAIQRVSNYYNLQDWLRQINDRD